ncbi:MAG: AMP-binding protein, partial [Chloroflexi bacterium]|nr:AMP-binding protein [Chloroflexota bacterium]
KPDFVAAIMTTTRARLLLAGAAQRGSAPADLAVLGVDEFAAASAGAFQPVEITPDDLAEVVFTSGSTSAPKGVMLTHGNIIADVNGAAGVITCVPEYVVLSVLPLSHMFEQTVGLCQPLLGGSSIVYLPALQPAAIFRAFEREGITCMLVVPQVLTLFLRGIEREADRQGKRRAFELLLKAAAYLPMSLRRRLFPAVHQKLGGRLLFFVSGGAYLDPQLQRRWERLGVKVVQGYGATEAAPIIAGNNLNRRVEGSVGAPLAGVEVRLAPDGEILARGANIMRGYWENPALTAEALRDGWYHTGDLGEWDAKGNLYLRGRKKSMIVLANGLNVHPEDVEQVLTQDQRVKEAVVLGMPKDGGVEVHAVLLLAHPDDAADVVRAANRRLASHQAIRGSTVWREADFPRTHTMKVKRSEVEETLKERLAVRR